METYSAPALEDLGSVAELTQGQAHHHKKKPIGWNCS
jgi:hypothetical protein